MDAKEAVLQYDDFIRKNGNSDNVRKMYVSRVRRFLAERPEALDADSDGLRAIVDEYVDALPVTSGKEVGASAVRYFWTMRFGRRYFPQTKISDFEPDADVDAEGEAFASWLRLQGTCAEDTVSGRVRTVLQFLHSTFAPGEFSRTGFGVDAVRLYVSGPCAHLAPSTVGRVVTDIRSYARFLASQGVEGASQVLELPLKSPNRSRNVGPTLSAGSLAAIVEESSGDGERALRDRAAALLMSSFGLRASDVARLTLDDVDWANGLLHVRDSKSRSERTLPMDEEVGLALQRYVIEGRSSNPAARDTRAIFLVAGRERGAGAADTGQISRAMTLLAQKAGVADWHGTHAMRRAAASDMVRGGTSVKVVADVLGHEDVRTTMRYLQVDVEAMRAACSRWPGGGAS